MKNNPSRRESLIFRPCAVLALLIAAAPVRSAPGELDPAFGVNGRVLVDTAYPLVARAPVLNTVEAATSIFEQDDGNLLVGRKVYYWSSAEDFSVMRFAEDGKPDLSFDQDGHISVELPAKDGATHAVLQLANGRILAAGATKPGVASGNYENAAVVRYLANGAFDRSFGTDGLVEARFGGARASLNAVVEQPDGRLIVGGVVTTVAGTSNMLIARYTSEGQPDASFGAGGSIVIDFGNAGLDDEVHSLAIQTDGKILASGAARSPAGVQLATVRLTAGGALDPGFGQQGRSAIDVGTRPAGVPWTAMRLQSDGRIVLAVQGAESALATARAIIARVNPDASLDATFGASGIARISGGNSAVYSVSALAIESDGSLIVGGTRASLNDSSDPFVTRLSKAGAIDLTFGDQGFATIDLAFGRQGYLHSLADPDSPPRVIRQRNGGLIVAASDQFDWDGGGDYFVLARLRMSGSSPGLLGMTRAFTRIDEGGGAVTLTVRRTGGAGGAVSVQYSTVDGDARSGADFTGTSGTLLWAAGDTAEKSIRIDIMDDAASERSETFVVQLSNPTGGADLTTDRTFNIIQDNEPAPTVGAGTLAAPTLAPPAAAAGSGSGGGGGAIDLPFAFMLGLFLASSSGLGSFNWRRRAVRHPSLASPRRQRQRPGAWRLLRLMQSRP